MGAKGQEAEAGVTKVEETGEVQSTSLWTLREKVKQMVERVWAVRVHKGEKERSRGYVYRLAPATQFSEQSRIALEKKLQRIHMNPNPDCSDAANAF